MVDEFAAMSPPIIRPTKPTGRNMSIAGKAESWPMSFGSAFGNALVMSASSG